MLTLPRLAALAAIAALCAPTYALDINVKFGDGVKLPSGLKWQKVGVTSKHKHGTNIGNISPQQQEYLYRLWGKEIAANSKQNDAICSNNSDCGNPENILFAEFALNGVTHRFSSAAVSPDINGCGAGFMFNIYECEWRYEGINEKTGDIIHTKSFRMCANVGYADDPRKDIMEFAVDSKKSVVYFTVNKISDGYDLKDWCSAVISIK